MASTTKTKIKTHADAAEWPPQPRANPKLVGHASAEQTLFDAFHSGRMHHAWLITGPKGVGKATLAHRFARYVLEQHAATDPPVPSTAGLFGEPQDDGGGGEASALYTRPHSTLFKRCAGGGHADLLVLERQADEKTGKLKTTIPVDDARKVGTFLSLTSAEGGWRVVVIDSVDEMNANAANAILKVLEEPPKNVVLLLVSHTPGRLLATIRSRCRRLALSPLPDETVIGLAHSYLEGLGTEEAGALAELAEGSIGRALSLAEAGGIELWQELNQLLDTLPRLNVARLHKLADKVSRPGAEDAFATLTGLYRVLLERLILEQTGQKPGVDAAAAWAGRVGPAVSLDRWFQVWEKGNHLVARTEAVHLDRRQVVLDLFLGLESTLINVPRT